MGPKYIFRENFREYFSKLSGFRTVFDQGANALQAPRKRKRAPRNIARIPGSSLAHDWWSGRSGRRTGGLL
jgi:hypothetical protein